jgi:hypothetical protein
MDTNATSPPRAESIPEFSIVRGDLLDRVQRRAGLVPRDGNDGVLRRMVLYTLLAWLPLVIWAFVDGRVFEHETEDPLLRHFGLHVRFLVALPLLIYGERLGQAVLKRVLPRFVSSGLIPEERVPAFREVIAGMLRLRDSALPWVVIASIILAAMLIPQTSRQLAELDWAREGRGLGFGGWWYLCVSRPLLQIFLFAWLWRIVLVTLMLKRIAKLGLETVPTHPDGLAGLGFIEALPQGFLPMAFAMSCILSAQAAHDVLWHGVHVVSLRMQGIAFGIVALGLCLAPLLVFVPVLKLAKRKGLAEYGDFTARHERLVHRRWIDGRKEETDEMLDAPELGPSADIYTLFNGVRSMRILPFSSRSLLNLALPVLLPMLAVGAIEIPLAELFGKIFKTVF